MTKQEFIQQLKDITAKGEQDIEKLNKKTSKYEEKKNEIVKSVRSKILTTKRIYMSEELTRLNKLNSVEEQSRGLKDLIDSLFIDSTLGTANIPTHFMQLYLTKDMITKEINFEVYREKGTPLYKNLENECASLISNKSLQNKQVDYITAKIISSVRLQSELNHQETYYNENPEVEFTVNTTPIEFDADSRIIYGDMLNLLIESKVLNKNKELVKLATTFQETKIATHTAIDSTEKTIYSSYGTEFIFNDEGVCVALKLNGTTAAKEDIIAEYQKLEQTINQDKANELNNNL